MKKVLLATVVFGLFLAACWFTACQKDLPNGSSPTADLQITDRTNADSKVFPPSAHPYGKSYAEWIEVWAQQFMTADCDHTPWIHPASVLFYTDGPVYILAGIAEVGGSADITIPHGKAVLFPLVNSWWDYPCPEVWGIQPPEGMSLEEYLPSIVEADMSHVVESSLSVTVDGAEVSDPSSYKFATGLFELTANPVLADCFDPCVTGEPQPAAAGGYYMMIKPLSRGLHTIHYHSEAPGLVPVQDATYNITVE